MIDVKPRWWLSFDGACLAAAALFAAWVGWANRIRRDDGDRLGVVVDPDVVVHAPRVPR